MLAADDRADGPPAAACALSFTNEFAGLLCVRVRGGGLPEGLENGVQIAGIGAVWGLGNRSAWNHSGRIVLGLLIGWALRASVFFWVVRLIAFFNDGFETGCSWRLAAATALPGALLLTAESIVRLGALDLIHLLILAFCGWSWAAFT